MKPATFDYHRAYTVGEAVGLLRELGEDAKILAGGQSLAPMMNFRLARPSALVDVNRIPGLDEVRREGDELLVGALTRHRSIEINRDPGVLDGFGLLPRAARWIGHYPIRCRGTVGGSVAHSDPTAEWCLLAALFDALVVVQGPDGAREVAAGDWFQGFLTTAAAPDEMVVQVRFRRPRSHGALTEYARRRGDFAIAAVGVAFDVVDGRMRNVGIILGGVAATPVSAPAAVEVLEGASVDDPAAWVAAARAATSDIEPPADLTGSADYRRQLVETLTHRAIREALEETLRPTAPNQEAR